MAPSTYVDRNTYERMGINIASADPDGPIYRATYFISREMWRNGQWQQPEFRSQFPGSRDSTPDYKLKIERCPPPAPLGEARSLHP